VIGVSVEIDLEPARRLLPALGAADFGEVAALALNDTAKNAVVEAAQTLRPLLGIPSAEIKAAMRIEPATSNHLEADLVVGGRPIPLVEFHPRQTQTGTVVQIAGKQEQYAHTFIRTMRTGHRGVFRRKGRARLPITEVYGPSVHGMLARHDVLPPLCEDMRDRLVKNLQRQGDRRARRNAGRGRR
jgi:Prophage minor tail protein Z (GPZ)